MTGLPRSSVAACMVAIAVAALAAGCFGRSSSGFAGAGGQCRVNADCATGEVCVTGVCATAGAGKVGASCTTTRDCGVGLYCSPVGTCATGGMLDVGQACTTDAQCLTPLRCNLNGFFGACAMGGASEPGAACQKSADCLSGLYCGRGAVCAPLAQAFPPFAGAACHDDGVFRAYFEVPRVGKPPADFFRLPFPNDIRVGVETPGQLYMGDFPEPGPGPLGVDLVKLYVDAWTADFDGFSGIGAVTFRFSAAVDFATATANSVLMVDVTPGPSLGQGFARSWAS